MILGQTGSAQNIKDESGSNYLCLPTTPQYDINNTPNTGTTSTNDNSYIYGVQFQISQSNLFNAQPGSQYDVYCSVCKMHGKSSVVMVPARITCPTVDGRAWKLLYRGFLMSQKQILKRTEYICVDQKPDLQKSEFSREIGYLSFVETRCASNDLPCREKKYFENLELSCVVCAL